MLGDPEARCHFLAALREYIDKINFKEEGVRFCSQFVGSCSHGGRGVGVRVAVTGRSWRQLTPSRLQLGRVEMR